MKRILYLFSMFSLLWSCALFLVVPANFLFGDQVILDDLIVDGSACIGDDSVNGENFGFDTIRLKGDDLRFRFVDTSHTYSFPTNDWQITINDSANGGANKFSIDDIYSGWTPFTILAGAPSHSLYVDGSGNVGLGTNSPTEQLTVIGNIKISGSITEGSSREFKKDIAYVSTKEAMETLMDLDPVKFKYRADILGEERLGFIAEDVPELLASKDRQHLSAMEITAILAKVVKEQRNMFQTQQETMDAMNKEIEMLKIAMNYGVK